MPAAIAMATPKLSPVLPVSSKPSSLSTSASINQSTTSVSTISIPVSAFHDPASNVITITPYIFVKTATVAEQMQALRQDKKIGKPPEQPAGALRVKRRTDLSKLGLPDAKPASVSRRNARERNRVKQVNLGFETLREHVPNGKKNKKMSKVQTLRSAAQYIKDLYMILHGELPALGSPNLIEDNDPNSPIDNSMCSISDTDNDASLASPEPKFQNVNSQHDQMVSVESMSAQDSPISPIFNRTIVDSPPQQQQSVIQPQIHQQQQIIVKTEKISVLQQQLSRGQLSQLECITNHMKYQQLQQQQQQQQQQQTLQQQLQQSLQQHEDQQPEQQQQHQHEEQSQQPQLTTFDPSALRVDPHTCTTLMGLTNVRSFLEAWNSAMTFTELSPVSVVDEQCDNYVDVSPEPGMTRLDNDGNLIEVNNSDNDNSDDINMDITRSPELVQPYLNDLNMNVINATQTDIDALQLYYKSVHNEHFKNAETCFVFGQDQKNNNSFLFGHTSQVVHSPASSLGSTASTTVSETDACGSGQFDYDNVDREALLDISNWISEICSQGMHINETGHTQQASLAYIH